MPGPNDNLPNPIPKIKRPAAPNAHDNGDAATPTNGQSTPPSGEAPTDDLTAEIEDFSANRFWDMTDEQEADVPLPPRPTDFTPAIPPAGSIVDPSQIPDEAPPVSADPLGGGAITWHDQDDPFAVAPAFPEPPEDDQNPDRSDAPQRTRPARAASPRQSASPARPVAARSVASTAPPWVPRKRRSMRQIRMLVGGMLLAMVAAATTIWFIVPPHSIVEGHLAFENTPARDTPAWQTFEAQQRSRLADPATSQAAISFLSQEYSDLQPGFLSDAGQYAAVVQGASFQKTDGDNHYDLVLRVHGTDWNGSLARTSELLKALYQSDNDIAAAAAQARGALADWQTNFAVKQQQLDDLNSRIDEQKKLIAAAVAADAQLKGLQTAADQAEVNYTAAQKTLDQDQAEYQSLSNQLSLGAPNPAATQPTRDATYADLQAQIQELTGRIDAAKSTGVDTAMPTAQQNLLSAEQQLDREFASALDLLKDYPDTVQSLTIARQLQGRISDLNDQLILRQHDTIDRYAKRRLFVERATRQRQQAVYAADDQIQQLRDQLALAQNQLDEANQANSTVAPEDKKGLELEVGDLRKQLNERQVALNIDEDPTLHERLGRLIDTTKTHLRDDQQAIQDTMSTLTAQLEATPPMSDITSAQKESLDHVMQGVRDLMQAEAAFTAASLQAAPAAEAIIERQEQVDELKEQADLRRQVLAARPAATQQQRQELAARRDALATRLVDDHKAVDAAHDDFFSKALAGVDAALAVQAGRTAERNLAALLDTRDAKTDEIDAFKENRDSLEQAANSTLYVRQPVQSDVWVAWDDSTRKTIYTFIALIAIGGFFGWLLNGGNLKTITGVGARRKTVKPNPGSPAVTG